MDIGEVYGIGFWITAVLTLILTVRLSKAK